MLRGGAGRFDGRLDVTRVFGDFDGVCLRAVGFERIGGGLPRVGHGFVDAVAVFRVPLHQLLVDGFAAGHDIRHGLIAHRALVIEEFINLLDFGVVLLFQQGVFLIELFLLPLDGLLFFVFLKVLLLFGKLGAQLGLLALGGGARVGGELIQPRFDLCDIRALFGGLVLA